eukprot:2402215-Prymnesium_polylepis.1
MCSGIADDQCSCSARGRSADADGTARVRGRSPFALALRCRGAEQKQMLRVTRPQSESPGFVGPPR